METEGGSQLFETAEKGAVMKNGPLKGGESCKYRGFIKVLNRRATEFDTRAKN